MRHLLAVTVLLFAIVPGWAQVRVTPQNPSVLQGVTGVTTDTSSLGSLRITYGNVSGSISMEFVSPTLIVTPCGQASCLPLTDVRVRHTFSGIRQLSILVGTSCNGPTGGFGFVVDSLFTCPVPSQQIDSQNRVAVRALITIQRAIGEPTVTLNVLFNWLVDLPTPPPTCPASDARPARAADCEDGITLDFWLPSNSNKLFAVADLLPAFCGTGSYTFTGQKNAELFLRLLDEGGNVIATSSRRSVPPGSNEPWGGGCFYAPDLVVIPESPMPSINIPPAVNAGRVLTTYRLRAEIRDVDTLRVRYSNTADFPVVPGAALKLSLQGFGNDTLVVDALRHIAHPPGSLSATFFGAFSTRNLVAVAELDLAADNGILEMEIRARDLNGGLLSFPNSTEPRDVVKGFTRYALVPTGDVPAGTASIEFEPRVTLPSGQVVRFQPTVIRSDAVQILRTSPSSAGCRMERPETCLVLNRLNTIEVLGSARPVEPGFRLVRIIKISSHIGSAKNNSRTENALSLPLEINKENGFTDRFDVFLPAGTDFFTIEYHLQGNSLPWAIDSVVNSTFIASEIAIAPTAANTALGIADGVLKIIQTNVVKPVQNAKTNVSLGVKFGPGIKQYWDSLAVVNNPPLIDIGKTWSFSSPIPRNGSFTASLTLNYGGADLPTDPNFAEPRLQLVSLDAAGVVRTYPTTLDLINKTATAEIDSLEPSYSLGVVGPFAGTVLTLPGGSTGTALVNTGTQEVGLSTTGFVGGQGTPATSALAAGNLVKAGPSEWTRASSESPALRGVSWMSSGPLLAVQPASEPGLLFAVPDVEFAARKTTELRWANTTETETPVRITLYNANGTVFNGFQATVGAKLSGGSRIEAMFPALPKGFVGYATVASDQPVLVSAVQIANNTATAVAAQPMSDAHLETKIRYAPRLGESEGAATIHLLNLGTTTASITLRARNASGGAAGSPQTISLAPRNQYTRTLSDVFAVAANSIGSVQMESTTTGVVGDLNSSDSSLLPSYGVSLPLTADPATSLVLPFATESTAVYIYNPGSTAASVGATAYSANGVRGATSSTMVPAFGRGSLQVNSDGYVALASSQPVVAAGFPTTGTSGISGYLALPSAAISAPPTAGGSAPSGTAAGVVNAASFKGGSVSAGEIVTIFGSNFGTSALTVLRLLGNGRVATDAAQTRFLFDNIAAPIIYVVSGQASVVVPYSVAGKATTQLVIEFQGRRSDPITLNVSAAAPGLFSVNSSGAGPGAILNQNGSVNTPQNVAEKGSVVILFGTGEGRTSPLVTDGSVTAGIVQPTLPVSVTIGGVTQKVLYAGAAPSLIAGVLQINVEIDPATPGGNQPVVVTVGGVSSQAGLTVAIAGGGGGPQPAINVTPGSLDFGTVTTGQTRDLTLTIRNNGTASLTVNSITSTNSRFAAAILNPPFSVSPGSFQTATIRFSPTAAGVQTGTLTINSTDPAQPAVPVSLSGNGAGASTVPVLILDPASLDFGSVTVGQSRDLTVAVRNTGTATLTVTSVSSSNARFGLAILGTPFSVGAGSFQTATIRFSPIAAGGQAGTITFASNDPASPSKAISVSGTGALSAVPAIVLDPVSLDFGTVAAGQTRDLTVTVRNSGTGTLTVSSVTSSDARFALVTLGAPFSVGPGSFQSATIRFSPASTAVASGTIAFASNDPVRPVAQLAVSGNSGGGGGSGATKLTLTGAAGWPNARISNQLPPLAIDGSTSTFTWTTEAFNAVNPSYFGVSLGASTQVSRLRIFKDNNAGGPGLVAKNLTIEYTTSDPAVPLASRVWTQVTGLANGFSGTELLNAAAVNANGTVAADNHDSQVSGWASLTFTPVNATGIRIGFSNAAPISVNHYRVYELELYGGSGGTGGSRTIAFGQTVNGVLNTSSGRSVGCSECYADVYEFTLTATRNVVITLNSGSFDAFLTLLTPLNEEVASDDDSGGGLNARIMGILQAGVYRIEVSTLSPGEIGAYTLTVAP